MHTLYVFSVWLHLLAVAVWIGSMAFLAFVFVPLLSSSEDRRMASALLQRAGTRLRVLGWTSWVCFL
jgi:uncharacterized membrane protein